MRNIIKYAGFLLLLFTLAGCDSYLDRQPDESLTIDKIFNKRETSFKYLMSIYSFMIDEAEVSFKVPWTGASDESHIVFTSRGFSSMNDGTWNPDKIPYREFWNNYYKGIREATFFIRNIDRCPEISEDELNLWKAEARFLRAYYYFWIMRIYGPVILIGEDPVDFTQENEALYKERSTWDECVQYVVSELDAVAQVLPAVSDLEPYWYGRPTDAAAKAVKARLLLYSARPLFNGNPMYKEIVGTEGKNLFPTAYSRDKWVEAANANKAIIGMTEYQLCQENDDPYKDYSDVFLKRWNKELLFSRTISGYGWRVITTPRAVGGNAYGGVGPTQKMVDSYAMANGYYPVTGYNADGSPVIDSRSEYVETGFSNFTHPMDNYSRSTIKMYQNREPRFYVSVFWSGASWKYGIYKVDDTQFHFDGNSGPGSSHNYPATGYIIRKFTDHSLNTKNGEWGSMTWPLFRLAETYLNYAEALNEYDPGNPDILVYLNKIRKRAGMKNLEEVYPEAISDQSKMRELILRERQVELAFEGHRYFDTRTWLLAEETENGPVYGMNVFAKDDSPNGEFWKRTVVEKRVFRKNHYLFPISQEEMDRNKKISQNYLW
ncbi:MAG: RagB/SusD family nutrient uptake outer membrane protein [Bacteroidales bacterium]